MANSSTPTFINKMLALFGSREYKGSIVPDNPLLSGKRKGPRGLKLPENTPLSLLWNFFLTEQYDTYETLKNRMNRYTDIDFAVKNNTLIQAAADLYADEATQCDVSGDPVRVNAKSDVVAAIEDCFDQWGINQQTVRESIYNKVVFGDAFDANDIDEKEGIRGVTQLSVWDVADRLEFDPSKLLEHLKFYANNDGVSPAAKIQSLMSDLTKDSQNPSDYFKKYLLGFELKGGQMVSPWAITHYRTFSMLREFSPWGRSQFINVLPGFRQLMSAEGLMEVARASSFPRDFYAVETEPGSTSTEKWEALEEFSEQLDNAGLYDGSKEIPSIGSRLIVPKDLVDYQQLDTNLDLDKIADVEYLRDNLVIGLFIPKGYLIIDQGGWGVSGQSLLQQFKPFGRKVFSHQSDYLAGLTEKIKLHFAITGQFEGWDTPFELLMDFPVVEESSERTQHKAEELTLAKDTIDSIKDVLGVDIVPPEIVKDAFGMMTSLPQDKIDYYVNKLMKANDNQQEEDNGFGGNDEVDVLGDLNKIGSSFGEKKEHKLTKRECYQRAANRWQESTTPDVLIESSLRIKAKVALTEGHGRGDHFRSSLKKDPESIRSRKMFEAFSGQDETRKFLRESVYTKEITK